MGKRPLIGIIYQVKNGWIGGTYYIQNLISALALLADNRQPQIVIYTNTTGDFEELKRLTGYDHLIFRKISTNYSLIQRVVNRIGKMTGIDSLRLTAINRKDPHCLFVYPTSENNRLIGSTKALAWKPDFQEKHLPHLFPSEEIARRDAFCEMLIHKGVPCVFSSFDSLNDYKTFYDASRSKAYVVHFAVKHPDYSTENIDALRERYSISSSKYLFCANQFWVHKNHLFLFEAFKRYISESQEDVQLICSGTLLDNRNKSYSDKIRDFISSNHLENNIKILGFIERTEQLCLMKNSYAIVQPSLFEGWSTVVEDAKAMNKFIFLSELNVHKEQAPANVCFFDPHNINDLATKLASVNVTANIVDYDANIRKFAESFASIIDDFKVQRNDI